jgi:hypothetical protein
MQVPVKYIEKEYYIFVKLGKLIKEIEKYENSLHSAD